jgi:hypothetical protein
MSTRFYFPSSGAAAVSPAFDSLWDTTSAAVRLKLTHPKGSTSSVGSGTLTDGGLTGVVDTAAYQFVSDPIVAGAISGTFTLVMNAAQGGGAMDGYLQTCIRVVSNDGTTVRGTLFAGQTFTTVSANSADPNFELGTIDNRAIPGTLSSVTAQAGDRLVVEVGWRTCNTSNALQNANFRAGEGTATDLQGVNNGTGGTTDNPWVEFSQTITILDVALAGNVPAVLGAFDLALPADLSLAGTVPAVLANFDVALGSDITMAGTVPAVSAAFGLYAPITDWHVDLDIGGLTWSIDKADPADYGPLDGLRIGWRYPDSDIYPTQPEPVTATIRLLVADIADLVPTIDEGSPVTIEVTGAVTASFVGRVAEMEAVPVKRTFGGVELFLMLVTFRCVDHTVDRAADQIGGELWPAEDTTDRLARIFTAAGLTGTVIPAGDPVPVAEREAKADNAKNLIEHYLEQWPLVTASLPDPHRAILAPDGETLVEIPAYTTGGRLPAELQADGTLIINPVPPVGSTLTPWLWNARQILFEATWSRLKQNGATAVAVAGEQVGLIVDDSGVVPRVTATIDGADLTDPEDAATLAHMYRANVDDNGAWVADGFTFLAYLDGSPLAETSPILDASNAADVLTGTVTIYNIPATQNPAHPGADWYAGTLSAAELTITDGKPYLTFTLRPDIPRPPNDDPIALTWDDLKAAPYAGLTWDDLDPNITWADARLLRRP